MHACIQMRERERMDGSSLDRGVGEDLRGNGREKP